MLFFAFALMAKVATTTVYRSIDIPLGSDKSEMIRASVRGLSDYYGLDYNLLDKTIRCESSYNPNAYVPMDVTGRAVGLFQFHDDTFYEFAKKLGLPDPDIFNPYQQIETAAYMFSIGLKDRWTCAREL